MKLLRILPTNPSDAMYLLADFSRIQWGEGEKQPLTKKASQNGIMIWLSVKSLELESVS